MLIIFSALLILLIFALMFLKNKFITLNYRNKEDLTNLKIQIQRKLRHISKLVEEKENGEEIINNVNKLLSIDMGNIYNIEEITVLENKILNSLKNNKEIILSKKILEIDNECYNCKIKYNDSSKKLNDFVDKYSIFYNILKFRKSTLFLPIERL